MRLRIPMRVRIPMRLRIPMRVRIPMRIRFLIWTTVLFLLLAGCGVSPTPEGDPTVSPLATPAGGQETSPLPTETATALPNPTATPAPLSLLVLHTNDNWGETEPCG